MQTLQPAPFVDRLDIFRTDTLAKFDPVDKKTQAAANAAMDELLESTVGLGNLVISDMPISNTRAALYIHLNASVRRKDCSLRQEFVRAVLTTYT